MAITGDGRNFSTTASMGLRLPTPGVCGALGIEPPGLSWLEILSASLGTLDAHTHAPGFGSQIPTAGIALNADLPFNGFKATTLAAAKFSAQTSLTDAFAVYFSGVDLYANDGSGNVIRLTSGAGIAGTPGSISGLASPAAASYTPASKLFAFTSSSGFAANLSCGPVSIGDATLSAGKSATLKVPGGLAANYNLTLPGALPGVTSFVTLDATGAVASGPALSGGLTTSHISGSAGILGSQLSASAGILGSQLSASAGIVRGQLAAVGQQVGASTGSYSNTTNAYTTAATVTITTGGRPVVVSFQPDGNTGGSSIAETGTGQQIGWWTLLRDGVTLAVWKQQWNSATAGAFTAAPSSVQIDVVGAGAHTYTIQGKTTASDGVTQSGIFNITNYQLVVYEL